jgi:hypothetical protein
VPRAQAAIYKWVDGNGIAHYTTDPERIPEELRSQIDELRDDRRREREEREPAHAGAERDPWANLGKDDSWATPAADSPPQDAEPGDAWAGRDALVEIPRAPDEEKPAPYVDPAAAKREAELHELDQSIASLRAEIELDEERLKLWISDPAVDPVALADDGEFREIAHRLPRLQDDLHELEARRRALGGPTPIFEELEPIEDEEAPPASESPSGP